MPAFRGQVWAISIHAKVSGSRSARLVYIVRVQAHTFADDSVPDESCSLISSCSLVHLLQ